MYPDFLGIGAQKAGTTWLYRNLRAHPGIHIPRKEIHYFDKKIEDRSNVATRLFGKTRDDRTWRRQVGRIPNRLIGARSLRSFLGSLLWNYRYYMKTYDDRWYSGVFEPGRGRVLGEITPAYATLDKDRVARAHELMPDAKIVFFLRNPIERAWSHTVMSFDKVEQGSVWTVPGEEVVSRAARGGTRRRSDYLRALETWGSFYDEDRFFVGFLEDVHFFPEQLLRDLYSFLGVDPRFAPPLAREKVHARSGQSMPADVAASTARAYRDEMARLHERFGGYASFWLYCADRLVETASEGGSVSYPLFGSSYWEEWTNGQEVPAGPQSGPLPSLGGAR